ncbi:hypothetical protein Mgra_00007020 [Meloidogyne graminicola]|uniref:Uncharacterized protein n=1 Tax=Meloidogyne graminicola TaxID=189291 RepID=A0A8S9ZJK6_9BILA|nr:hypothetical protein Mgra_00007020 [Meloidogyne graminicola]
MCWKRLQISTPIEAELLVYILRINWDRRKEMWTYGRDIDERDHPFIDKKCWKKVEGFYRLREDNAIQSCIGTC